MLCTGGIRTEVVECGILCTEVWNVVNRGSGMWDVVYTGGVECGMLCIQG